MSDKTVVTQPISQAGIDLVKRFEGLRLEAYRDAAGVWTIGWGHTAGVKEGDRIDEAQAEALLAEDLAEAAAAVDRLVRVPLNAHERAALTSWVFNLGAAALGSSTALKWLNEGDDREAVANALTWWNKARIKGRLIILPGLVDRRAAEAALFLTPVEASEETMP